MGKYDNNPIIRGRFDSTGMQIYWQQGFKGRGVKVAVIDSFTEEHGHQMVSIGGYIAPEAEIIKLEMYGHAQGMQDALLQAAKLKVDIVSLSRSVDSDTKDLHDAVKACYNAGILVVCSAGNTGKNIHDSVDIKRYPAYYPETVSVLSIDNNFTPSKFSSHNTMSMVSQFGQNILVKNSKGEEMLVSGTSPATAIVAFTMALHLCKIKASGKSMTVQEQFEFIKNNTIDMNTVGKDNLTGYGFFTLDKDEFKRVKLMILDADKDGLEDRVTSIKAKVMSGIPYEEAERTVSSQYYIVGYEIISGIPVPIYGGRKQTY